MPWPKALVSGFLGLALLGTAAACTWQGLRPEDTDMQRLYIVGSPGHVEDQAIIAVLSKHLQAGFFELDLDALRDAVVALPWVAGARVYRRWPDGLVVRVREHRPVALWGQTMVLAADGSLFRPPDGELPTGLPTLTGPEQSQEGMWQFLPELRQALAPMQVDFARVELSERGAWTVTLANGLELRLGRSEMIERAARFATFGPAAIGAALATAGYVDLRYDNGFAVGGERSSHGTRGTKG